MYDGVRRRALGMSLLFLPALIQTEEGGGLSLPPPMQAVPCARAAFPSECWSLASIGRGLQYGSWLNGTNEGWLSAEDPCGGGGDVDAGFTSDVGDVPARLDYAFVGATLRDRIQKCWVDEAAEGSDHQPVWVELSD